MANLFRSVVTVVCGIVLFTASGIASSPGAGQVAPADDRATVAAFTRRVQAYVDLHRRIEGPIPTVAVSVDPGEIRRAIDRLGNAIRAERVDARQGDIFTPDVAAIFRRIIAESCVGDFRTLLAIVHEDEPPMPRAELNGRWPAESYPFMPPKLLLAFPSLPEELEYLFVNRDLVLWDWHADLIVDMIPNAIPRETT